MKKLLTDLVITAIIILCLDLIYLYFISDMFKLMIRKIQNKEMKVNFLGAISAYIILTFALYFLVLRDKQPIWKAALLGFAIYGIYDATNMATITDWDYKFVIVDTIWGIVCFSLSAVIFYIYDSGFSIVST